MSGSLPALEWLAADGYAPLRRCDRRAFAWEWLRRSPAYRRLWNARADLPPDAPMRVGLLAWADPGLIWPEARPIWNIGMDPKVVDARPATGAAHANELFDILSLAPFLSVEVDTDHVEHWLFSDGHWVIRLDVHDGTLLGGPMLLEYRLSGRKSAKSKLEALHHLLALSEQGMLPSSLVPRERRADQWILELRVADALQAGASQQEMARVLFNDAIAPRRWRSDSSSYRLRIQRLVRIARHRLSNPLSGPWFQ
jgi:hypothetical protein